MIIKKISDLTKDLSKEELRKRIAQVGAVSLGVILTLSGIPVGKAWEVYKEEKLRIEQQRIEEENAKKEISLLSCQVLVENCPDGSVKHHFVNDNGMFDYTSFEKNDKYKKWTYEYRGITNSSFVVPYSEITYNTTNHYRYIDIPETRGKYIFDYNVPYYVINITDISLLEGYSLGELYSVNDLKELEEKLNNAVYENKNEEQSYYTFNLLLAEVDGEFMCFDFNHLPLEVKETTDIEDVTKLRTVYYIPCVENNLMNLKISSGMNAIEDDVANIRDLNIREHYVIDDITSLDQTVRNDLRENTMAFRNLYGYLEETQDSSYRTITREELDQLLDDLNAQKYQFIRERQ